MKKKLQLITISIFVLFVISACINQTDASIKELSILGITKEGNQVPMSFDNPFSSDVFSYIGEVESNVEKIMLYAVPSSGSEIDGNDLGIKTLAVGENNLKIDVKADKVTKTYQFYIVRKEADTNSYLKGVTLSGITLEPGFIKTEKTYTARVPYEMTKTIITAETESKKSRITAESTGEKNLLVGENKLPIVVTAEDGNIRTYTFIITRDANVTLDGNATIRKLSLSEGNLDPVFAPSKNFYMASVSGSTTSISISAEPYSAKSKVIEGTGEKKLYVGNNLINIVLEAENGTRMTYTVLVNRADSSNADINNNLSSLSLEGITLTPAFDKNVIIYQAAVSNAIDKTTISAVTENTKAVLNRSELGGKDLKIGVNIFEINVTAENGAKKSYSIVINRYSNTNQDTNADLSELSMKGIPITPPFDKDITVYTANVPVEISETEVVAKTSSAKAEIEDGATGLKNIAVGINQFQIKVTAESGTEKKYSIVLIRETSEKLSKDNQLKLLTAGGINYTPNFSPDVTLYTAKVGNDVQSATIYAETVTTKAAIQSGSLGKKILAEGVNTFLIPVTSEDGTKNVYTILIEREYKDNNTNLSTLTLSAGTVSPAFDKTVINYSTSVGNDVKTINITAAPEKTTTSITGTGIKNLNVGVNVFEIKLTSQAGTVKNYTVIVTREPSGNNNLSELTLTNGTLSPSFNSEITAYTANVAQEITSLEIGAVAADTNGAVTGTGTKSINTGENKFSIVVRAENGTLKTYVITITRMAQEANADLSELNASGVIMSPSFSSAVTLYIGSVSNSVTSTVITAVKSGIKSTVAGDIGTKALTEGVNTFTVTVTAENGATKTYTIVITRAYKDTNTNLSTLTLSGGALSPAFDKTTLNYSTTVANSMTGITIGATGENGTTTVTGTGIKTLAVGANVFEIKAVSQDGSVKAYTVVVTREASGNNNLSALTLSTGTLSPVFTAETTNYTANVGYGVTALDIGAAEADSTAAVTGRGTKSLNVGENIFNIVVQAQNGIWKTYTVTITRAAQEANADLSTLTASGATLSPVFNANTILYTASVGNSISSTIIAVAKSGTYSTMTGDIGTKTLSEGVNTFTVMVTAENGVTKTYTIVITRAYKDTNTNLSALTLSAGTLSPAFDKTKLNYSTTVANSVTGITIGATGETGTTTVTGTGIKTLAVGANVFEIKAVSQDGSVKAYTVVVTREASGNNNLSSLILSTGTLSPVFTAATTNYTVNVSYGVTALDIGVTSADSTAAVTGTGTKTLNVGANIFNIVVRAENGTLKTYTVTITRAAQEANADLSTLTASGATLSPVFNANTILYTASVANNISSTIIAAAKSGTYSTMTGDIGTKTLSEGINTFTVMVTAENGITKTYTIVITRAYKDTNTNLSTLTLSAGTLSPAFDKTKLNYSTTVANSVTGITIGATGETGTTTVTGTGIKTLAVGANVFEIKAVSQDGSVKAYTIVVTREASGNNNLSALTLSTGALSPVFTAVTTNYTANVVYGVTALDIGAAVADSTAAVTGTGTKSLNVGANIFNIVVRAENGTLKTYTVTITRAAQEANADLGALTASGAVLSPSFNPNTILYTASVANSVSSTVIAATKSGTYSVMTGDIGTKALAEGVNTFTVTVTAENGVTKTYTIVITRAYKDTNTNLSTLTLSGGTLSPAFDKTILNYSTTVANSVTNITVGATGETGTTTVTGTGIKTLAVGANVFEIKAVSQDGSVKAYTVVVTREASGNNNLSSLILSTGTLSPVFTAATINYTANVSYGVTALDIGVTSADSTAAVTGTGTKTLNVGANIFNIVVRAENGTLKTYTVTITRAAQEANADLGALTASGAVLSPSFNPNTILYTASVANSVSSTVIAATKSGMYSVMTGDIGTKALAEGVNTFTVTVTAENGSTKSYTIVITRAYKDTNTNLSTLTLSGGTLSPAFDKTILNYSTTVANSVTNITVGATGETGTTTVTGTGIKTLAVGANVFEIKAVSQDGSVKAYTVVVTREASGNNNLSSLTLSTGTLSPVFTAATTNYTVNVSYGVTAIDIGAAEADSTAAVTGTGTKSLNVGANIFNIVVRAENGALKTYTLAITRAEADYTTIKNLVYGGTAKFGMTNYKVYSLTIATAAVNIKSVRIYLNSDKTGVEIKPTSGENTKNIIFDKNIMIPESMGVTTITSLIIFEDGTSREDTINLQ